MEEEGAILPALGASIKAVFGAWNDALFREEAFIDPIERFSEYNNLNISMSLQDIILV